MAGPLLTEKRAIQAQLQEKQGRKFLVFKVAPTPFYDEVIATGSFRFEQRTSQIVGVYKFQQVGVSSNREEGLVVLPVCDEMLLADQAWVSTDKFLAGCFVDLGFLTGKKADWVE